MYFGFLVANRMSDRAGIVPVAMLVLALCCKASQLYADDGDDRQFLAELSSLAIGTDKPVADSRVGFYKGVALTPIGAAWTLSTEPDESAPQVLLPGSSRLAMQFNFTVDVRSGIANAQRADNLEQLWDRLLMASIPQKTSQGSTSDLILFKKQDRVDRARGAAPLLEPSEEYERYLEYRSAWALLAASNDDDGGWRLHPRFQQFSSIREAKDHIAAEWERFGYKVRMESAIAQLESSKQSLGWREWLLAKASFDDNTISIVPEVRIGTTRFFPSESNWSTMPSWNKVTFGVGTPNQVSCQIARVEVLRPWMRLSLLSEKTFVLDRKSDIGILCDGVEPTALDFSRGRFANLISELVIVRQIKTSPESNHRLARFTNPEVINLIGYVVTILPRLAVE